MPPYTKRNSSHPRREMLGAIRQYGRWSSSWALEQPDVLLDINHALTAHRDRSALFGAVMGAVARVVNFDRASLTLLDRTKENIVLHAISGREHLKHIFPLHGTFKRRGSHLEDVVTKGCPVIRRDLTRGSLVGFEHDLLDFGLRSYVSLPLLRSNEPFGSINIGSCSCRQYGEDNLPFLMDVARPLALAVDNLVAHEEIALLQQQLEGGPEHPRPQDKLGPIRDGILGRSKAIRQVLEQVATAAPTDANVLVTGETGTGKDLVARAIHRNSSRRDRPLVTVNCASIPRDLCESEFFGHVKGAFTGALRDRVGRFEIAQGGTLFLDEVAEIPYELQGKLLRVLQEGQFERVGDARTRTVDVRVIAATNRDLSEAVAQGRFREDLFYRLNVFPIEVPPLRERTQDIPLLTAHFVSRAVQRYRRPAPPVAETEIRRLMRYPWPGNLRELQSVVDRAVIGWRGGPLCFEIQPELDNVQRSPGREPFHCSRILTDDELRRFERANILAALYETNWKVHGPGGAAELLGIPPTTLASRMERLRLRRPVRN